VKNIVCLVIVSIFLFSCAGIGIRDSSDPYKKLNYAYSAMANGRHVPAERLIIGAMEKFTAKKDNEGLAEAYIAFGDYYAFKDWVNSKPMISAEKSIEAYDTAISMFEDIGKNMGIAKSYFGLANAYGAVENTKKLCESYNLSLVYYKKGIRNEKPFRVNSNFSDFPHMVNSFKASYCR